MSTVALVLRLAAASPERMDGSWPPVLVAAVAVTVLVAVVVVAMTFRRLRAAARAERLRPRGWQR